MDMFSIAFEKNKAIIRRWFDAENKKDLSQIEDIVAPDFVDQSNQLRSREEYKKRLTMFIKAFPDFQETIEDIIAEGNKIWVRFKFTGTHTGEWNFLGTTLAPTGKKITWTGVHFWQLVDDKIVNKESLYDFLAALKQLDFIEYKRFPEG